MGQKPFTIHRSPFTAALAATRELLRNSEQFSGDHSAVAPPVPIPNTEVKRCSPDGSATIGCARVGRRQNKSPGEFTSSGVLLSDTPTRAEIGARHQTAVCLRQVPSTSPLIAKAINGRPILMQTSGHGF